MALKHGYSHAAFDYNVAMMLREGFSREKALAVAYDVARRAFFARFPKGALPGWLTPKSGKRMKNPVPPSRTVQVKQASKLYEEFTGHNAELIGRVEKPVVPDVMAVIGDVDGILYSTVRDGKLERYIHEFAVKSRPLFAVSHDGKSLHMLGGAYDFTERGIVDKTGRKK